MSLWYDIKHKNYVTDHKNSWIRSYAERLVNALRNDTDAKFSSHFKGALGRHIATDIECENGITVQTALDNEISARTLAINEVRSDMNAADSAIRSEMNAADMDIRSIIAEESESRVSADNTLQANIEAETSARETALSLKVDKESGKVLSSNDYTDAEKNKLSGIQAGAQVNSVTSVAGRTGAVTLSKSDVGLSNIDNTSDANKPISTATQSALNSKADVSALDTKANKSDVLTKTNTTSFTPTSAYHPATKKYVDDSVSAAGGGDMLKNVYDTDGDGIVDNAGMLGGQPPSYYATATALDGRAIRSHASAADTYGLGNTSLYGHLKVADNLTTTTVRGIALSANQGRVLNEKITALQTPPTLTSVTTDGVAIGTDNWTGTGYFCTSSGTKYVVTHNVSTATSSTTASAINGFNRFCLKPVEATREWQNWTPYFVYNGVSYEFFYSPSRGLYEALIPATGLTAAQVLTYIEWKRYAPTILNYGKLRALCYFDIKDTTSGTVTEERRWIASEPILRDTSGEITEEDYQKAQWFIGRDWWLDLSSLDVASLSLIFLLMDVSGNGRIVNASALYLQNIVMGSITRLPIETIDNFS